MKYDFDSILARLRSGVQGTVSTLEGTFAGDLLQSVAAELARIWSQEVDTAAQRGFLATAEGQWLDAVCGDYGSTRKSGESDEGLRARALEQVRSRGGGGTAADYVGWTLALEGVAAASAVPLARGAGTVNVYFVPAADAPEGLDGQVSAALEERRPVGADVQAIRAQSTAVNVSAAVTLAAGSALDQVKSGFSQAMETWLAGVRLREQGEKVSLSRVIGILMNVPGVEDVGSVLLNGKNEAVTVGTGKYAVLGTVTVTEADHG